MAGVSAHGGIETTASPRKGSPGYLKWYWTKGAGRAKWNTWRELRAHLIKFMNPAMADRVTSVWYHDATGVWSGSDLNRVRHGKPPRGKIIGPG